MVKHFGFLERLGDVRIRRIFVVIIILFFSFSSAYIFPCPDPYFYVGQGRDMLQNGLRIYHDNLSIHSDLTFTNQRFLVCILTYFIYSLFGETGIFVATIILNVSVCFMVYCILEKYDKSEYKIMSFVISFISFVGFYFYVAFRAVVFTSLIYYAIYVSTEKFINKGYKHDVIYYGICFVLGCLMMWVHSSNWFFCFIMLMPYLFDFKFLHIWVFDETVNPIYSKLKIWVGFIAMFLGSLLNPYGVEIYDYVYRCATVTAHCDSIKLASEMESSIFSVPNIVVYVLVFLSVYIMIRYKTFVLRSFYFTIGSLLISLLAYRLSYNAIVLLSFAIAMTLRNIKQNVDIKSDDFFKIFSLRSVFIMGVCGIIGSILFFVFGYVGYKTDVSSGNYNDMNCKNMIIRMNQQLNGLDDVRIFSTVYASTYSLVDGAKTYIDARSEFFDDGFYGYDRDLIREYILFSVACEYDGLSGEDAINAFQDRYAIDYYVIPVNSDKSDYQTLQIALDETAYCNYRSDSVCVYSFVNTYDFV